MSSWNRRKFLQVGTLTAAGVWFASVRGAHAETRKAWNERSERGLRKYRSPKPTLCRACPEHCAIFAFRDGDRVVQILGNEGSPTNRGGICPRAYGGLERVYDSERVLTPLARTGPRGSGQWEPISWEKALAEITRRLEAKKSKNVLHLGQEDLLVEELRDVFPWQDILVDEMSTGRPGAGSGEAQYGAPMVRPDILHARTVLLFEASANGGGFATPLVGDLVDARRKGAELHLIDSVAGTAAGAAQWHPVYPGTEEIVALGMARLIFRWNKIDFQSTARAFCPSAEGRDDLLEELGRLLTDKPEIIADRAMLKKVIGLIPDNPVKARAMIALMPESDEKQLLRELVTRPLALMPLLSELADALDKLQEMLTVFTPEVVKELADFPPGEVVTLARRFVDRRPSVAAAPPGSKALAAVSLLNNLTGAVDVLGGAATARGPFFLPQLKPTRAPEAWLEALVKDKDERADLLVVVDANPAYDAPGSAEIVKALSDPQKIDFLVAMDTHLTETAKLADLFLPMATSFESWGIVEGCLPDGRSYLYIQQPVTRTASEASKLKGLKSSQLSWFEPWSRPLGEARSFPDILAELAHKKNPARAPYSNTYEYMGRLLIRSWGPGSFEGLRARGIWVSEEPRTPPVRKVSAYEELLQAVPPKKAEGLRLVGFAPKTLPRHYANTRLGREIFHDCSALVHPDTATLLKISQGDHVTLTTEAGSVRVPVKFLRTIHPRTVLLPDGFGHTGGGSVAQGRSKPSPSDKLGRKDFLTFPFGLPDRETQEDEPIWWEKAGAGVSLRTLYPSRFTGEGVFDWGPVEVKVEKS